MASYPVEVIYSYKKGRGNSCGTRVHSTYRLLGKSESAILAKLREKHGETAEIIINSIKWRD